MKHMIVRFGLMLLGLALALLASTPTNAASRVGLAAQSERIGPKCSGEFSRAPGFDPIVLHENAAPAVTNAWARTYGGTDEDAAYAVTPSGDGGYIFAGQTHSFGSGGGDAWVFKLDGSGNLVWQKAYGGTAEDSAQSIVPTSDGGYVVAGSTKSYGGGYDNAWIFKLNAAGKLKWQRTYGGSGHSFAESVARAGDGGYIVAGLSTSYGSGDEDVWVIKTDASGSISPSNGSTWQKTFGGKRDDEARSVFPTSDGGYIVAGSTNSYGAGGSDAWVLKLNDLGYITWQKTFGGSSNDLARSVIQTSDGYVFAGETNSFGEGDDAWVTKMNSSGHVVWSKTYTSPSGFRDYVNSIVHTSDGGYIMSGVYAQYTDGSGGFPWVLKLDALGNVTWQRRYWTGFGVNDRAYSIKVTSDGDYVVAGSTIMGVGIRNALVMKLNAKGKIGSCSYVRTPAVSVAWPLFNEKNTSATVRNLIWFNPGSSAATVTTTSAQLDTVCVSGQ